VYFILPKLEVLEQTGALRILLYLFKNGESTLSELLNNISISPTAIYKTLSKLLEEKLIEDKVMYDLPRKRVILLTKKGEEVAKYIDIIRKVLESTL